MLIKAKEIQMVDLHNQYKHIKTEIDTAVLDCIDSTRFINGPQVKEFQAGLEHYLDVNHVVTCANGTDALQIALMSLDLRPGDEVILPAFTYVATAEVVALLQLRPVMVDVDPHTFNVTAKDIAPAITAKTKAIVPVHLFGQSADLEGILALAGAKGIKVIEDNAQTIGADYTFSDGTEKKTGTIGDIGCTSFYPSKTLGCFGDGGAISTNDEELAMKLQLIANHGQQKRYYHDLVGVNSRLDTVQAAVLNVKLRYLDQYIAQRQRAAAFYDQAFQGIEQVQIPHRQPNSTHVFHQYTILVKDGQRDELKSFLAERGIPSMIYYPLPLYRQKAYRDSFSGELPVTEELCRSVLSLPMHTEMDEEMLGYITDTVKEFWTPTVKG